VLYVEIQPADPVISIGSPKDDNLLEEVVYRRKSSSRSYHGGYKLWDDNQSSEKLWEDNPP
ncbi:hypothetical protein Dsin_016205, partial [Dipteronia sinensis]